MKPTISVGTKLPQGVVSAILNNGVEVELFSNFKNKDGLRQDDHRIREVREVTPACQHNNAVLSDDNEPATYHCPDCGDNFIGESNDSTKTVLTFAEAEAAAGK